MKKIFKIGAKKIPYLGIFKLEFGKTSVILKSVPTKFVTAQKFVQVKNFEFGTKNALFTYFWIVNLKNDCYISNQHSPISQTPTFWANTKNI